MAGQKKDYRGLQPDQTLKPSMAVRKVDPPLVRLGRWMKAPINVGVTLFGFAGAAYVLPQFAIECVVLSGFLTMWALRQSEDMPIKLPIQSKMLDGKDNIPGLPPGPAQGIFFFGNRTSDNKQLWLTNDDCRQHFLVLGTTGSGKSLPNDALVHTPVGWKRMGDIRVGDLVSTPDGRSAPVNGVYPQGELDIYEVEFEDGRVAEACPEHLWEVHHKHWHGKYKAGVSRAGMAKPRLLRTREVAELLARNKGKFSVRLAQPVEKPVAHLPLQPYALGALIGDGNLTQWSLRMTSEDAHILDAVNDALCEVGHELKRYPSARPYDWNISSIGNGRKGPTPGALRKILRELDLEDKAAHEKRIPRAYMEASVEQRWELLRGLMDTDGSAGQECVSLSFSTSSPGLADDVKELVRSLGGIAKTGEPRITHYRDKDGNRKAGRLSYRVNIRHPQPALFFSLPRKVEVVSGEYQYADSLKLHFKEIRLKRRAEATCIRIDHPDHLFITNGYVVTHNTENLLGFVTNALTWSSGFLFCDGKGDVSLFAKVFALSRRFGREDDLLVLNMMTGNSNIGASGGRLLSNTLNPFAVGSADNLTQLVVSLMDDVGGDGAMWKGRATAMFTGVMRALTYLRDEGYVDLNVGVMRDHLNLRRIIDLCDKDLYPNMDEDIRVIVRSYLTSLPGYQEEKKYKQAQTTLDQHGYLEMQFTKILGSLADVYGHIFKTPYGEIDMHDVVLNRRILVVMLPALEKSGDELANLGKIVVATLKGMMGGALGNRIEGSWEDIVDTRVTNSPSPFLVVLDEVGYYTVEGLALMAAQARSLGFSMIYASQDIPAMKRLNEKEAASIIANTNTKIFMRTEEMEATGALAVAAGGKGMRTEVGGFSGYAGEFMTGYRDSMEARTNVVDRVDTLDLKGMGAGDMAVMYKDEIIYARTFHADPPKALDRRKLKLRTNHFIRIAKPSRGEIESAQKLPLVLERLLSEDLAKEAAERHKEARESLEQRAAQGDPIAIVAMGMDQQASARRGMTAMQASCAALHSLMAAEARMVGGGLAQKIRSASSIARDFADEMDEPPPRVPPRPQARQDQGFADPRDYGRPQARDMAVPEELDFDGPMGRDGFDPLAGLDRAEAPHRDQPAAPPRGPRRPTHLRGEAEHTLSIGERTLDTANRIDANDAVLRMLADLDYDPERSTADEIERRIEEATGAPSDPNFENVADPEDIDYAAYAVDTVTEPVAESTQTGEEVFISDILASLIDEEGSEGGK